MMFLKKHSLSKKDHFMFNYGYLIDIQTEKELFIYTTHIVRKNTYASYTHRWGCLACWHRNYNFIIRKGILGL